MWRAILRLPPGSPPEQKAIALYNSYGFGYSIGMNFRSDSGRREMLFFEDLQQIAHQGFSLLPPTDHRPLPERRVIQGFVHHPA